MRSHCLKPGWLPIRAAIPTSVILGLRPLIEAGWIDMARGIVCDCKSGVSGAGKEPKRETHFVEVNENFRAYGFSRTGTRRKLQNTWASRTRFYFHYAFAAR